MTAGIVSPAKKAAKDSTLHNKGGAASAFHLKVRFDGQKSRQFAAADLTAGALQGIADQAADKPLAGVRADLQADDLKAWAADAQRTFWRLWRAVQPGRRVTLVIDGDKHTRPIDVALGGLVSPNSDPEGYSSAVAFACGTIAACYPAEDGPVNVEDALKKLNELGVKGKPLEALRSQLRQRVKAAYNGGTTAGKNEDAKGGTTPFALARQFVEKQHRLASENAEDDVFGDGGDQSNVGAPWRRYSLRDYTEELHRRPGDSVKVCEATVGFGGAPTGFGGGAAGLGGAIFNMGASTIAGSGTASLTNCTLTANTAQGGAGHLNGAGDSGGTSASLTLNNSILAASTGGNDLTSRTINGNHTNLAVIGGHSNLVESNDITGTVPAGAVITVTAAVTADPNLGPLHTSPVKRQWNSSMNEINTLIENLEDPSVDVRIRAARKLAEKGTAARRTSSALERRFAEAQQGEELRAMREALESVDPSALQRAAQCRADRKDRESFRELVKGISPEEARGKIERLVSSLGESEPVEEASGQAYLYLTEIALEVPQVIPDYISLVTRDDQLLGNMALVLGQICIESELVHEEVVGLLAQDNPAVVGFAASLIGVVGNVGAKIQAVIEHLTKMCAADNFLANEAICALTGLAAKGHPKEVVDALVRRATKARTTEDRRKWCKLLCTIAEQQTTQAVDALVILMRDPPKAVRKDVIESCRPVAAHALAAALREAINDADADIRRCAVTSAGQCPKKWVAKLVPSLIQALDDSDEGVQSQAVRSLGKLGPAAREALATLQQKHTAAAEAMAAARTKFQTGEKAPPALLSELKAAAAMAGDSAKAIEQIRQNRAGRK